jgi:hypothetical protein
VTLQTILLGVLAVVAVFAYAWLEHGPWHKPDKGVLDTEAAAEKFDTQQISTDIRHLEGKPK